MVSWAKGNVGLIKEAVKGFTKRVDEKGTYTNSKLPSLRRLLFQNK